ncbi:hypothetical protein [Ornithinimicrobium sp. INDO-MA30-4]|uniref:hypothetical protein n=1 Tax=Ornithinimicrobium sp. INDO-MA30-4 TaxID=2908651 RepID=UPI001F330980|nr:hypothetical protein [Ornithinimicrobium sp. INDO-MA30-4]UJH71524.1 hypothetical protein L0A91_07610 [Ornithinimicrobium sp. INDO-MA30-4]
MPRETTVTGPGQFQNEIESSNETSEAFTQTLSQFLSLNRQAGSTVQLGNLLTLPIGGGLLYVEPIYVQASSGSSYPLQRLVVVAFGNDLAWSDTLDGALDELFGGDSGATAPDSGTGTDTPVDGTDVPVPDGGDSTASPSPSPSEADEPVPADLEEALADIETAYADGQAALREGDLVAYGEAQERLEAAINRAVAISPSGSVSVAPSDDSEATATP